MYILLFFPIHGENVPGMLIKICEYSQAQSHSEMRISLHRIPLVWLVFSY